MGLSARQQAETADFNKEMTMNKFFALLLGLSLGFAPFVVSAATYHYPASSQGDQGASG